MKEQHCLRGPRLRFHISNNSVHAMYTRCVEFSVILFIVKEKYSQNKDSNNTFTTSYVLMACCLVNTKQLHCVRVHCRFWCFYSTDFRSGDIEVHSVVYLVTLKLMNSFRFSFIHCKLHSEFVFLFVSLLLILALAL